MTKKWIGNLFIIFNIFLIQGRIFMTKVALIGTGPCGLSFLRSLYQAKKKSENIPEVVAFDKQSDWGGLWNYSKR